MLNTDYVPSYVSFLYPIFICSILIIFGVLSQFKPGVSNPNPVWVKWTIFKIKEDCRSWVNVICIVMRLWAGLFLVWILAGTRIFSVLQNVQTVCGAQKPSYKVDADTPFLRSKVVRLWSWSLISIWCWG